MKKIIMGFVISVLSANSFAMVCQLSGFPSPELISNVGGRVSATLPNSDLLVITLDQNMLNQCQSWSPLSLRVGSKVYIPNVNPGSLQAKLASALVAADLARKRVIIKTFDTESAAFPGTVGLGKIFSITLLP